MLEILWSLNLPKKQKSFMSCIKKSLVILSQLCDYANTIIQLICFALIGAHNQFSTFIGNIGEKSFFLVFLFVMFMDL